MGRHLVFDIEGDGLLKASAKARQVTTVWCIGAADIHTGETFYWGVDQGPSSIEEGLKFLGEAEVLIAHYGNGYDFPALEMLYPAWTRPAKSWDSIVMAKVVWPYDALIGPDLALIKAGKLLPQFLKAHSLKAWGQRLGNFKADYDGGFDAWSQEMADYMMQDVDTLLTLCRKIYGKVGWIDPRKGDLVWPELTFEYECEVDRIIKEQEEDGVRFDVDKAIALSTELRNTQAELEDRLVSTFGSWWAVVETKTQGATVNRKRPEFPDVTNPRYGKNGTPLKPYIGPPLETTFEGSELTRVDRITFQPSSRDHLGQRLKEVYGWVPKTFGKDGKPTVDETTLEEIPEAVLPADIRQTILDYFVVSKTLGTLTQGSKAWLRLVDDEGRIHGGMDTVGAVTRRGTHKNPNLSGTPSVQKEKITLPDGTKKEVPLRGLKGRYGYECRDLFGADDGWELTGVDASALELIDLGHYLFPLDGGAFSARVCDPLRDPHQEHGDMAGMLRGDAKTAIYLKVYGGSAFKLSLGLQCSVSEIPHMLGYRGLPQLLKGVEKRLGPEFVAKMDDMQKAKLAKARQIIIKLEAGIDGLKDLIESVQKAAERGWLKAIDGSKVIVRKPHAALNSLLQSAGAITCKLWMMLVHRSLRALGLKRGVDFKQVLWVHDELQFTHRPGLGPVISEVAKACIVTAGEMLGLRGVYRGDAKTGHSWADCH